MAKHSLTGPFWAVFIILLAFVAFLGLKACLFSMPFFGTVISNCPADNSLDPRLAVFAEREAALRELEELKFTMASLPGCVAEAPPPQPPPAPVPNPRVFNPKAPPKVSAAEELIVIMDTSGSMTEFAGFGPATKSIVAPFYAERNKLRTQLIEAQKGGAVPGTELTEAEIEILKREYGKTEERIKDAVDKARTQGESILTRAELSSNAVRALLESPPKDMPVSVWRFQGCGEQPARAYPSGSRTPADVIKSLEFKNATPLVEAIQHIPKMVSSGVGKTQDKGLNVVLLSDGAHSCEASGVSTDPCAAARQVKRSLPFAWIHVVSVADDLEQVGCIAEATGGLRIESADTESLQGVLRYVAGAKN